MTIDCKVIDSAKFFTDVIGTSKTTITEDQISGLANEALKLSAEGFDKVKESFTAGLTAAGLDSTLFSTDPLDTIYKTCTAEGDPSLLADTDSLLNQATAIFNTVAPFIFTKEVAIAAVVVTAVAGTAYKAYKMYSKPSEPVEKAVENTAPPRPARKRFTPQPRVKTSKFSNPFKSRRT